MSSSFATHAHVVAPRQQRFDRQTGGNRLRLKLPSQNRLDGAVSKFSRYSLLSPQREHHSDSLFAFALHFVYIFDGGRISRYGIKLLIQHLESNPKTSDVQQNPRPTMEDEWKDDDQSASTEYADEGRSYGKGRGFKPHNNGDGDYGSRRGGGRGGGRGGSRYGGGDNDENGDDGGSRRGRGGGGYRGGRGGGGGGNRYGDADDEENGDDGGSRRGRGGSRGGRGGGRRDDGDGGFGDNNGDEPAPVKKEIYIPPEPSNEDSDIFGAGVEMGINFDKYDKIEVKVSGENAPQLINQFEEAGLRPLLLDNIRKSGYTKPTPIQKYALPMILAGRDLMACAQTGSGKTAAFMVPIVNTLLNDPRELVLTDSYCEPQAVIVAPTRELAIQIYDQARKFAKDSILKCVNIYGGTGTNHQRSNVLRGCHILVATTGRLMDFVNRECVKFSSLRYIVLDEADRMLDLGFLPDIEKILDNETMVAAEDRQTLMFSATFPEEIQQLAGRFLNNYLFLAVGIIGGACQDVEQSFHQAGKFEKREKLKEILQAEQDKGKIERTLVFVEQKRTADFLAAFLSENNFSTTSIHGDREQREREEALRDFKSGNRPVLVATAVAARGLDIKDVAHVINFDIPKSIDEYVHRIGRTGRVGNRGKATSFFDSEQDGPIIADLVKILKQANQPIPGWLESGGGGGGGYSGSRTSKFGGRDVRKFDKDNGQGDTYPEAAYSSAPAEPEEEW